MPFSQRASSTCSSSLVNFGWGMTVQLRRNPVYYHHSQICKPLLDSRLLLVRKAGEARDPDAPGHRGAQLDGPALGLNSDGLVVIPAQPGEPDAWPQVETIEKFHHLAIPFVDTDQLKFAGRAHFV